MNAPALSESGNPVYKPWIELAEKLGKIVGSLHEQLPDINLVTSGSCLATVSRLMATAFSCGLAKTRNPRANLINANALLKDLSLVVSFQTLCCQLLILNFSTL